MADTRAAAGLTPQQWDEDFFTEYLGNNPYSAYMGTGEDSIFQIKEDAAKKRGDSVTFALLNRLRQDPITGSAVLEGNEEDMTSRSFRMYVDKRRNAVRVADMEEKRSAFSLRNAARPALKNWAWEQDRNRVQDQLLSKNGVLYDNASEAEKDAWLVDNADRVLFGAAKSNNSSNDHSASLANIDNTSDKLTPGALSLMKRIALTADPKITPINVEKMNKRFFVVFAHPFAFRDLKTNATITQAQREVTLANQNNKLFQGGDIEWDGMIIHEDDSMPILTGVGNGGIDVAPVFLVGAQALGLAIARRWKSIEETFDYGDKHGVAIETIDGLAKLTFGTNSTTDTSDLKDHGVVTGYFAAVADS